MIWDQGTWTPDFDPAFGYKKGHLEVPPDRQEAEGPVASRAHEAQAAREERELAAVQVRRRGGAAGRCAGHPRREAATRRRPAAASRRSAARRIALWASGQGEVTETKEEAPAQDPPVDAAAIAKARATPMPGFIEPTLPTATETAPSGRDWLHEIKHDGYRLQAHLENGRVKLFSRQGLDWTRALPRRRARACRGAGQESPSSTARWWCRRRPAWRASPCWSTR